MAVKYYELIEKYSDTIYNEKQMKAVEEMEIQYQTEKKQQEIEKQELQIAKNKAEITNKNIQRNAFIIGFIFSLIFFISFISLILSNWLIKELASSISIRIGLPDSDM